MVIVDFIPKEPYCIARKLAGIKFGGWAPYRHCKNIGGFKFGGR